MEQKKENLSMWGCMNFVYVFVTDYTCSIGKSLWLVFLKGYEYSTRVEDHAY